MEQDKPYKHWKNCDEPGRTCSVTCTCLDFAHLLHRAEMRKRMSMLILEAASYHQARLHAFAVMSHHIHFLLKPNESQNICEFTKSFKTHSSKQLKPFLTDHERAQLGDQFGLNRRSFWKVSFRAFPIFTEDVFWQKVNYIHQNPVRSGYVELPEEYPWSSGHLYLAGLCDDSFSIHLPEAVEVFRSMRA